MSPASVARSVFAALALPAATLPAAEHQEFEATLQAPYHAGADGARRFTLVFDHPGGQGAAVQWRLELLGEQARVLRRWDGEAHSDDASAQASVWWDGRGAHGPLPDGVYRVRLRAAVRLPAAGAASAVAEQEWPVSVGRRAAPVRTASAAALALPYAVYYGNLHSQSNHSDGGGDLSTCHSAQDPQAGAFGPSDAYLYARRHGLDFLMVSEHNHMYDGSDGANLQADPAAAQALYRSGLTAAADATASQPGFLALYGVEWGVIGAGGHLNVFNAPQLLGWEKNAAGQLVADTYTPRSDYAALYALMRQRGWIGQFNHPAPDGQFVAGGTPFGYTRDGDQAMVLCEVLNSSAFSFNATQSEPRRSTYEAACNRALEAGYHVAFSSDQDNHCANWGASYTNRTGVLIPADAPLTEENFMNALRARRVFATMDRTARLVFTANGHMMGERFVNTGALQLEVGFASSAGKTVAAVAVFEGVPRRNGAVTQVSAAAQVVLTPAPGEHFYYARLTEDDGNMLWSAPVWVSQQAH